MSRVVVPWRSRSKASQLTWSVGTETSLAEAPSNASAATNCRTTPGCWRYANNRCAAAGCGAPRATPAARRLARERGIDLAAVRAKFNVDVITESVLAKYLDPEP